MNKGLEQFNKLKTWYVLKMVEGNELLLRDNEKEMLYTIEKELKEYQEIREIAKRYNWDNITSEIFNVKTDQKYRDLFNSAIVDIQKDYRKARALEIIKELFDFDFAIRFGDNQPMIKITNKRNGQYWELPETTGICDLLKKVLVDD